MLTIKQFNAIPPGLIFLAGITTNDSNGVFMTIERPHAPLRWVAYKDFTNHWRIYIYWNVVSDLYIVESGEHIKDIDIIRKLIPCDTETLELYK